MAKKTGWIKVNLPLGPIYDYSKEGTPEKESMSKILKPGMLLELKSKKIILVGDINKNGGVCDDCHIFGLGHHGPLSPCPYGEETIVKRYKQLNITDLI